MKNILFIGNSFTYYNDLPKLVTELCARAGVEIFAEGVTKGGWSLEGYADPKDEMGEALRRIYPEKVWDYVVLQEKSLRPAAEPDKFFEAVRNLRNDVLVRGEPLLFYQTWAYRSPSAKLDGTGMDYDEMAARVRDAYEQAARETGGVRVPVGDGFRLCRGRHPEIELYQEDAYHPSLAGSYLAACLFCHFIGGLDPLELSDPGEPLTGADAAALRRIAKEAANP